MCFGFVSLGQPWGGGGVHPLSSTLLPQLFKLPTSSSPAFHRGVGTTEDVIVLGPPGSGGPLSPSWAFTPSIPQYLLPHLLHRRMGRQPGSSALFHSWTCGGSRPRVRPRAGSHESGSSSVASLLFPVASSRSVGTTSLLTLPSGFWGPLFLPLQLPQLEGFCVRS